MKTQSNRVVTVRLTPDEIRYLSELSVIRGITRSEVIREMITMMQDGGSIMENTNFTVRYVACLLTSLVRKMAGGNPSDAEKMIRNARLEAQKEVEDE